MKRVGGSSYPRHCTRATQLLSKNVAAAESRWQYCVQLTCPRFELQTSRFRDECVGRAVTRSLLEREAFAAGQTAWHLINSTRLIKEEKKVRNLFPSNLKFHIEIQIEITFTSKLKFCKIYCVILTRRPILFTLTVFHTVYLTNVFYTGGRANMSPY